MIVPVNPSANRLRNRARSHLAKRPDEPQFLELCREMFPASELKSHADGGNSGLWITILRQDPIGAWKSLREARAKKREGFKPDTTWPKYTMDLYLYQLASPLFRRKRFQ